MQKLIKRVITLCSGVRVSMAITMLTSVILCSKGLTFFLEQIHFPQNFASFPSVSVHQIPTTSTKDSNVKLKYEERKAFRERIFVGKSQDRNVLVSRKPQYKDVYR